MHCIVNVSALTRSVLALSGSGSGQGGGGGVGGYSVERRWRREERRRSGEFTPTCYQFVPPPWPSKRSGESETENECVHVWERKRTSLNECTHIHQHDKDRSCCIHGLFPYVVARYVSRASVWLPGWSLLSFIDGFVRNAGVFVVIRPRRSACRNWKEVICKVTQSLKFQNMYMSWVCVFF